MGAFGEVTRVAGGEEGSDDDVRALLTPAITARINEVCGEGAVEVISYRRQVVAGTNFLLTLRVGGREDAVAKIFRPLPHTNRAPELIECTTCTREEPPLSATAESERESESERASERGSERGRE